MRRSALLVLALLISAPAVAHHPYGDIDRNTSVTIFGHARRVVSRIFASWNQIGEWLRRVDALRQTA
jgi:hypothetical protein